jgi:hypothetical protein
MPKIRSGDRPTDADVADKVTNGTATKAALNAAYAQGTISAKQYGAKCDERRVYDAAITSSTTITSASANFTSADVGKLFSIRAGNATYGHMVGVITAVNSSTQITVNPNDVMTPGATGVELIYGTNDRPAIQAAVAAASALGIGSVLIPGRSCVDGPGVTLASKVSLIGSGAGVSALVAVDSAGDFLGVINGAGTLASPWSDITVADLEIDGREMMGGGGSYTTSWKGIFLTYVKRLRLNRLYVHDTPATGIGTDFLPDCLITECIVTGCGRLNNGNQAGGNGIGIGTGYFQDENVTIANCHLSGNKRFNIFVEKNGNLLSRYAKVIGCHIKGLGGTDVGVGDCGTEYFLALGNTVDNCGKAFFSGVGTLGTPAGRRSIFADNVARGSIYAGLEASGSSAQGFDGELVIRGNRFESGTREGIIIKAIGYTPANIVIDNNECRSNGKSGIHIGEDGGTYSDVTITNNRCYDNGQGFSGARPYGIEISANVSDLTVVGNKLRDTRSGASRTQTYGLGIKSGYTMTRGLIARNYSQNNATGGFDLSGTLSAVRIMDNPGYLDYTTIPETITPATSPWSYTAGSTPEMIYIIGDSTVTVKTHGGTVAFGQSSIRLEPFQDLSLTWTGTLTSVKRKKF